MLSRVADSLYWMSRYMERSDGILRMLKINYASSQEDLSDEFSWEPVLKIFTYMSDEEIAAISLQSRNVLQYVITDKENQNSVFNVVTMARENARSVQDHITKELWQCLNEFYLLIREEWVEDSLENGDPVHVLDILIKQCLLYYGTADITMGRGEGNTFMNIGKFLERGIQTCTILDIDFSINNMLDKDAEPAELRYLLLSLSGYSLYLKTYRSGFEARNVAELVILNTQFPRSVSYSIHKMNRNFERFYLQRNNADSYNTVSFMMGKIKSSVQYSTAETILEQGLHNYLQEVIAGLNEIGVALEKHYFAYL